MSFEMLHGYFPALLGQLSIPYNHKWDNQIQLMTTNHPLKVFLRHSSADKPAVRELYQKLRAEV